MNDMTLRVLLIDDDERLYELLLGYLGTNDCTVSHAPDGVRGLSALSADAFDVVLLDVMMPGIDGLEVCRRIRQRSQIPVIMLTAKGDETDRVVGLEIGADDYLPKPFSPRELLARMRAVLRRASPDAVSERITSGPLEIDVAGRDVKLSGSPIELTGLEFDILLALVRRVGRVVPREALLQEAGRGDVTVGERTVDVHISRLRHKLKDAGLIKTVRGLGYMLTRSAAD